MSEIYGVHSFLSGDNSDDVRAVHSVGATSLMASVSNGILRFYHLEFSTDSLIDLVCGCYVTLRE